MHILQDGHLDKLIAHTDEYDDEFMLTRALDLVMWNACQVIIIAERTETRPIQAIT